MSLRPKHPRSHRGTVSDGCVYRMRNPQRLCRLSHTVLEGRKSYLSGHRHTVWGVPRAKRGGKIFAHGQCPGDLGL
eukprot:2879428-Prymnesium_polylepis.1